MLHLLQIHDPKYNREIQILASQPMMCTIFTQCEVNGVKFVTEHRDMIRKNQNSGVTCVAGDLTYYGILQSVIQLTYAERMPVVLFKCKWYNTDPTVPGSVQYNRGLISVNTNNSWYDDFSFILATTATQVFYIDDPLAGEGLKVVNHMAHRGTFSEATLAKDDMVTPLYEVDEPYQEPDVICLPISELFINLGPVPFVNIPVYENEDEDEDDDYDEDEDSDDAEGFNNDLYGSDDDENNDDDDDDEDSD
ncbi:hypothetical protein LguiA_021473 [Lonicera macranthoides]